MLGVRNLCVARGDVQLLSGVNFDVATGQALLIRGPNGIGKTSLLRCLVGLQVPVSGQVMVTDEPVYAAHADGLKASLTAHENLTFWSHVYGGGDAARALDQFNLTKYSDQLAGNLSAGQRRRLGLARLIVTGCKLWVLDEPTVSLDDRSIAIFQAELARHLRAGGAAVISTHVDIGVDAKSLDLSQFKVAALSSGSEFSERLE